MIGVGFYPLVLGIGATSALIAYRDLGRGWVYSLDWVPALLGIAVFYGLSSNLPSLLFSGFISAFVLASTYATVKVIPWVTLRVFKRQEDWVKIAKGDYIALGLFSFWPVMVVYVIIYALTVGIVGFYAKWWNRGLRGIPLAGLMGVFCLLYIVYLAIV